MAGQTVTLSLCPPSLESGRSLALELYATAKDPTKGNFSALARDLILMAAWLHEQDRLADLLEEWRRSLGGDEAAA